MPLLSLTIEKTDFSRGASITDQHVDGGFSPAKRGHNIEVSQGGILYPQPAAVALATPDAPYSYFVAFAKDVNSIGNDAYGVTSGGRFYTVKNGDVTLRQTDGGRTYDIGSTNLIQYKGNVYATSTTNIAQVTGTDLDGVVTGTWWTATKGKPGLSSIYRHVMESVEDTLYISNGAEIHTYDGTTAVAAAMTLPDQHNITAMIKHPDGQHLIVFAGTTIDYGHGRSAKSKIFLIDTVNLEFIREIPIDGQVEGAINVGGVVYVTYGNKLGYFNGDGITFLRTLRNDTTYKCQLTNKEGILMIAEKNDVLCYGNLGSGNVFWYSVEVANNDGIGSVFAITPAKILTSGANSKLNQYDFTTVGGAADWDSNNYSFPSKVWIRKIELTTEVLASGSNITLSSVDKDGTAASLLTMTYAADGAISEKIKMCNIFTDNLRIRLTFAAGNTKGVKKIKIYYEDGE